MIDVQEIVANRKKELAQKVLKLGIPIELAIIQVGNNPASNSYIKGKMKDCKEVGITGNLYKFSEDVTPDEILNLINELNMKKDCKGIIVQLPLPAQFTKEWVDKITKTILPEKDVDGFRKDSPYIPCTPKGVLTILNSLYSSLEGKVVCVIGRSEIVGKPMVRLLIDKGCTVISCNSHTVNLDFWLNNSNIIISAVGKPNFLSSNNNVVWQNKVVIDVGINRNVEGKLCGDCNPELYEYTYFITPVPKGVGLTTRLSLLENTIEGI